MDTVGGGERYMLTIAQILSKNNQVNFLLDTHLQTLDLKTITQKAAKLLGLDLSRVQFIASPLGKDSSFLKRLQFLKDYDLLFYLTDGSIFFSSAKKNILHIQSPIKVSNNSLWKKIKESSWNLIIYNSLFTKENCQKFWNIKSQVIYPPTNTQIFKPAKKKKQIITVGRFFGYLKDKKHSLMIDSFKRMIDLRKVADWSFHLAGGTGEGDKDYIKQLQESAKGYPVYLHPNLPFADLLKMYGESSIYWHSAGFGETDPTKMEHFGITTVEAMASGCVPVVINLGGQKEIVKEAENGFLWNQPDELEKKSLRLMNDEKLIQKISMNSLKSVDKFSQEEFRKKIENIVS